MNNEELNRIEYLEKRLEELKPFRDEWQTLFFEYDKLKKKKLKKDEKDFLDKLEKDTKFECCDFINMENGQAVFTDFSQAETLCECLNRYYGYHKYFKIEKWLGAGTYILEPESRLDHDGEEVYTGIFRIVEAVP